MTQIELEGKLQEISKLISIQKLNEIKIKKIEDEIEKIIFDGDKEIKNLKIKREEIILDDNFFLFYKINALSIKFFLKENEGFICKLFIYIPETRPYFVKDFLENKKCNFKKIMSQFEMVEENNIEIKFIDEEFFKNIYYDYLKDSDTTTIK